MARLGKREEGQFTWILFVTTPLCLFVHAVLLHYASVLCVAAWEGTNHREAKKTKLSALTRLSRPAEYNRLLF